MSRPSAATVAVFAKEKFGLNNVRIYLETHFRQVRVFIGTPGSPFPADAGKLRPDICVSYMSAWIIPAGFLRRVKCFSLNFHPGTPAYRGIGCTNFAVYNGEKEYGVTAHLMLPRVDAGKIIDVARFPVLPGETLWSLTNKCYAFILCQFYRVFDQYLMTGKLPLSRERWSSKLHTRAELNALCRLDKTMSKREISRRIRATDFPGMPGACFSREYRIR